MWASRRAPFAAISLSSSPPRRSARIRAEYKLGEMLQGLQRGHGPGRGKTSRIVQDVSEYRRTLEDNAIAEWSAERWHFCLDLA